MPHHILSNEPMHIHPELTLFYRGQQVEVPENIGIDPNLYAYHGLDRFSGDMDEPGARLAPIHTHDSSGRLHVEASKTVDFTLNDFFKIWGLNLRGHSIRCIADGIPVRNYRGLKLEDGQQIAVYID
jgi:hypothetical protein